MLGYPPFVPDMADSDVVQQVRDQHEETASRYSDYKRSIESGSLEEAARTRRAYERAKLQERQAEAEVFWSVLGHAIADIADTAQPQDAVVGTRGNELSTWAIDADQLETIENRETLELIIARRYPTVPKKHRRFIESMFDLTAEQISKTREGDRRLLEQAGWGRRRRPPDEMASTFECPHCGKPVVIQTSNPDAVDLRSDMVGVETATRMICPHCDTVVFVSQPE